MNTRIPSIILLTILLASLLTPLIYLPATAAGTLAEIKTSTPHGKFYGKKVVEIRIYDPDVDNWTKENPYIEVNGQTLNLAEYAYIFPDKTLRIYIGSMEANDTLELPEGVGTVYNWSRKSVNKVKVYKLMGLSRGDKVTITYRDYTVPEGGYQDVSVTLQYAPMTAKLSTDRDETGIPPKAKICLTVVDSDANKNPFEKDELTLSINISISDLPDKTITKYNVTLRETGASTEEFTKCVNLYELNLDWRNIWPGDYIRISFRDKETGEYVGRTVPVLITNAILTVEPSSFGYPDTVTIELRDPDQNLDNNMKETINVDVVIKQDDSIVDVFDLMLVETGEDTGVFRAIITPILDTQTSADYGIATIKLRNPDLQLNDKKPDIIEGVNITFPGISKRTNVVLYETGDATGEFKVVEPIGVTIKVKPDLQLDNTKPDTIEANITITKNKTHLKLINLSFKETGSNTGVFNVTAQNITITIKLEDPRLELNDKKPDIVEKVDFMANISYKLPVPQLNETGNATGVFECNLPDNNITVRIELDPDLQLDNTKPDTIEANITITKNKTHLKLINLQLNETGANTSLFNVTETLKDVNVNVSVAIDLTSAINKITGKLNNQTADTISANITIRALSKLANLVLYETNDATGEFKVARPIGDIIELDPYLELAGNVSDIIWVKSFIIAKSDGTYYRLINLILLETDTNTSNFTIRVVPPVRGEGRLNIRISPGVKPRLKIGYIDTYYATYEKSNAYVNFTIAKPNVKFEKETYLSTDRMIVIVLENANLNDYPGDYDKITIVNGTIKAKGYIPVGNITVTFKYANGTPYKSLKGGDVDKILGTTTIIETGKNTGVFKIYLDLSKPVARINLAEITGGKVEVKIYDYFKKDYIEATASIGGVKGKIEVDRTELPLNPGKWVKVYFNIIDKDQNRNPAAIDILGSGLVRIEIYNATGHKVAVLVPGFFGNFSGLVLEESDRDTGVFLGEFEVLLNDTGLYFRRPGSSTIEVEINGTRLGTYNGFSMINGKIRIKYTEPLADEGYVYVDLMFRAHDAKLEVTPSTVSYGDNLTITLTAPDYNLDTKHKDKVTVYVIGGKVSPWKITLVETSENSGVFTTKITVGKAEKEKEDENLLPHTVFEPGTTYKVEFIDSATRQAYYSIMSFKPETLEEKFKILSHTAEVWVQADKVSPYGKIIVYVYDPDLLYKDKTEVKLAQVKADGTRDELILNASKSYGNGTFVFEIQLEKGEARTDNILQVNPVDTVYIYYIDEVTAEGSADTLQLKVKVVSETGVIETDKERYKPGEWLEITVKDFDRNKDSEGIDSVTLTLYSDSYPVGIDVTATETEPNSGVFTAKILLKDVSKWKPGEHGVLPVKLGDTVKIEYIDPTNETGKVQTITKTVGIAVAPPFPLKPTKPEPVKYVNPLTGEVLEKPKAGEWLATIIELSNAATESVGFDAIVVVYDEAGVPVLVQVAHNVIEPGTVQIPIIIGKLPAGTYTVKILLWENIVSMKPLSEEVIEFPLTVEE